MAGVCNNWGPICHFCAGPHTGAICDKLAPVNCSNCEKANQFLKNGKKLDTCHPAFSKDYPTYQMLITRIQKNIDYGSA